MAFELVLTRDAERDLDALEASAAKRIVRKLLWFAAQREPLRFAESLHDSKIGDARFRIGAYRAVVLVDRKRKRLTIVAIGDRKDIYH